MWVWFLGSKGKFHTLVSGFTRRRYEEMEKSQHEEKYEELKRIKEKNDRTIQELNNKLEDYQQMEIDNNENISKLSKLYELGVVNEDGEYTGKIGNNDY